MIFINRKVLLKYTEIILWYLIHTMQKSVNQNIELIETKNSMNKLLKNV